MIIETIFADYECTDFFDTDSNAAGVDVSIDGDHIGCMLGVSLPDENDGEEMAKFADKLETWIADNEY